MAREPISKRAPRLLLAVVLTMVAAGIAGTALLDPNGRDAWDVGEVVEVELALVSGDEENLACASASEIAGRHCAFVSAGTPWAAVRRDDMSTLRPYTTTKRVSLLAAGLWSEPPVQERRSRGWFVARCKYTVEGKLPRPSVRWAPGGPWLDQEAEWNAGVLSECAVGPAAPP